MSDTTHNRAEVLTDAEIAQQFHATYEALAPSFGYETRTESRRPWADVPEQNKQLMIAVCGKVRALLAQAAPVAAQPQDESREFEAGFNRACELMGLEALAVRAKQPQEAGQARNWTEDEQHENGNYLCYCGTCGHTFIGHKRRVTCKACAAQAAPESKEDGNASA